MPNPICKARRTSGGACKRYAVNGATVCPSHGGLTPQVQRMAIVRTEISKWQLGDVVDDPGEVLLRLISQSRRRADLYASLLEEMYAAADVLGSTDWSMPAGVRALIGHKYSLDAQGNRVPVEEAIRALVQLEAMERDRCANFAAKAIAAGLAERQVRVEEQKAVQMHRVMMATFDAVGITGELRTAALADLAARYRAIAATERETIIQ